MASVSSSPRCTQVGLVVAVLAVAGAAEANAPPTVPILNNPSDNQGATTTTPVFSWQASTDPDGDPITYDLEVMDDGGRLVGRVTGISGTVSTIGPALIVEATYAWRARATDPFGAKSAFSPANTFMVARTYVHPLCVEDDGGCGGEGTKCDFGGAQASRPRGAGTLLGLGLGLVGVVVRPRRRR